MALITGTALTIGLSVGYGLGAPITVPASFVMAVVTVMTFNFIDEDCYESEEYLLYLHALQMKAAHDVDKLIEQVQKDEREHAAWMERTCPNCPSVLARSRTK